MHISKDYYFSLVLLVPCVIVLYEVVRTHPLATTYKYNMITVVYMPLPNLPFLFT